jgi:NADPH:quinone reductase-like Zn-dependent oxidoreductase
MSRSVRIHEFGGPEVLKIEDVGPGVEAFAIGDRVVVVPSFGASEYGFYGE